jgi:arylsulfatase
MKPKLTKLTLAFGLAALVVLMLLAHSVRAAETAAQTPLPGTPSVLPRPDFHFPGNVGRTYLDSDPARFPQPVQAPKGAPNVVLILLDDAGFGQFSTFGGAIPSPTMDKLAGAGDFHRGR